ncbi:glycosyltransferase [Tautonia sp. JC769]|uniref:glycosyltransferase family 2 protein n=1 Tax=Tautonia sp. JC769 TaxID=3232135 RepID=UPI003458FE1A
MQEEPLVTIVVAPRERFSYARNSLESVLEHTDLPHRIVYVDGGSPGPVRRYLAKRARERDFELIRTEHYLSPNRARNLGLEKVRTKYVVFMDNDVVVTPGWLGPLVQCAEETGATVVSPLICQGFPLHTEVHCAGGVSAIEEEQAEDGVRRHLVERIFLQGRKLADVRDQIERGPTRLAEFHCMMVRTAFFEEHGPLDGQLLNHKEHVDFCLTVENAGGTVYLEPDSLMTYVTVPPMELSDVPYYTLRWSDHWMLASLERLRTKWDLTYDAYFEKRMTMMGARRFSAIIRPMVRKVTRHGRYPKAARKLEAWMRRADRKVNRLMTDRYARRHFKGESIPTLSQPVSSNAVRAS